VSDPVSSVHRFVPASVLALRGYTRQTLVSDLIAGVTVGLVALPLAMAFAISSGMTPQAGIYCAIVTGFIIAAFGGSTVQIGGPTGAFVVVVSGIIATYGVDGLFMCTMMAGVILVVMGLTGAGTAVRFIPRPVVTGFTGGIAVTIASTQLQDFFGITLPGAAPGEFIGRIRALVQHADTASVPTMALGAGVIVLILVWNRVVPRSDLPRRSSRRLFWGSRSTEWRGSRWRSGTGARPPRGGRWGAGATR